MYLWALPLISILHSLSGICCTWGPGFYELYLGDPYGDGTLLNRGGDYGSKEEFQFTIQGDSTSEEPTFTPSKQPSSEPTQSPFEPTSNPTTSSPTSSPTRAPIMLDLPFETPRLPASSSVDSQITSLYPTTEELFTTSSVSLERPAELVPAALSDDSNDMETPTTTSAEPPSDVNTTIVATDVDVGVTNGTESVVVSSASAETSSSASSLRQCVWHVVVGVSSFSVAWFVL